MHRRQSRPGKQDEPAEPSDPVESVESAVSAFQAGEDREENFRHLVETYYPAVKGYLTKRVFSKEECLDLTQDVFLRVYQGLDDFRGEARFRTWLFQIVHYTYLSWLRPRLKGRQGTEGVPPEDGGSDLAFDEHGPASVAPPTQADDLLREEGLQKLREAIDELPDQMRKCIQLRTYQDCSYKEIAAFLDLSIETVKVHLHVARKRLQEKLQDYLERPTPEKGDRP